MSTLPSSHLPNTWLADYHTVRQELLGNARLGDFINALISHRTGEAMAALDLYAGRFASINAPKRRTLAITLFGVRADRLTPEITGQLFDLITSSLEHLRSSDLDAWRISPQSNPELEARRLAIRLVLNPLETVSSLDAQPELLHEALRALSPELLAHHPDALDVLITRLPDDLDAQRALITLSVRCVEALVITLDEGIELLVPHLDSPHAALRVAALQALQRPWALLAATSIDGLTTTLRRLAMNLDRSVMQASITWLAHAKQVDTLELLLKDARCTLTAQQLILTALGDCATVALLDDMFARVAPHPTSLATPFFDALLAMHHRGVFVEHRHIPQLLDLYQSAHGCSTSQWNAITYTARATVLATLATRDAHDTRWRREVTLLDDLEESDDVLEMLLTESDDLIVLTHAAHLARLRANASLEEALCARLAAHPSLMLSALMTCGTSHTRDLLRALLDPSQDTPWLTPYQELATSIVWHLTGDLEARHALIHALEPSRIPRAILDDLPHALPDDTLWLLLRRQTDDANEEDALHTALTTLCAHASPRHMPMVQTLLDGLISSLQDLETQDEEDYFGSHRTHMSEVTLSDDVKEAIHDLGARLHARSSMQPACVLLASSAAAASHDLLNHMLVQTLITHDDLPPHQQRIALEALHHPISTAQARALKSLIWTPDPHVRKTLIRVLANANDPGIITWFHTLTRTQDDIETLRQTLEALHIHGDSWASTAVAHCLEHRNMNIKLTAARALAHVGDVRIIDRLIFWLGHHDHASFRTALIAALRQILGDGWRAAIHATLLHHTDSRQRMLLSEALDEIEDKSSSYDDDQDEPSGVDAATWFTTMHQASSKVRAQRITELYSLTLPSELALTHLADVLHWGADDGMAPHRAMILDWVSSYMDAASSPRKRALIGSIRALPKLVEAPRGLERLSCLKAAGALLTSQDYLQIITDARHTRTPHHSVTRALEVILPWSAKADEAFSQADVLTWIDASSPTQLDALPAPTRARALSHLMSVFASLSNEAAARALNVLLAHAQRAKAPSTQLHYPPEVIPLMTLLERFTGEHPLEVLDALLDQKLEEALELFVLLFSLEHTFTLDAHASRLARLLHAHHTKPELHGFLERATSAHLDRLVKVAAHLDLAATRTTLDAFIPLWKRTDLQPGSHDTLTALISKVPAMIVLEKVITQIEAGETGLTTLLHGALTQGPLTARLVVAMRRHTLRYDQAHERILHMIIPHIMATKPEAATLDLSSALDEHVDDWRQKAAAFSGADAIHHASGDTQAALKHAIEQLRVGDESDVLSALRTLKHHTDETAAREVLEIVLRHRSLRVRSTAWRTLRAMSARDLYLEASIFMLTDPRVEVQQSAIRALGFALHEPAIPKLISALVDGPTPLREEAVEALAMMPESSHKALIYARKRARPDKRHWVTWAIEKIEGLEPEA